MNKSGKEAQSNAPAKRKTKPIPERVLKEMSFTGAKVYQVIGEQLYIFRDIFYNGAWSVYMDWVEFIDDDLNIFAVFDPPEDVLNTPRCPSEAIVDDLLREVNSIIANFVPKMIDVSEPGSCDALCRKKKVLSSLYERIEFTKDDGKLSTLSSLNKKSYICTIVEVWANTAVTMMLFKY
jgi:hypothetical protein